MTQCQSCGGFCGNKCERSNVGFGPPKRGITITEDSLKAIQKEVEVHKYAADNYRRLLDESDHAYAKLKDERDQALTDLARCEKGRDAIAKRAQLHLDERDALRRAAQRALTALEEFHDHGYDRQVCADEIYELTETLK